MSYLDSWNDEESAARPLPVEESPNEPQEDGLDYAPDIRMAFEASTGLDGAGVGRGRALSSSLGIPEGFVLENPYKAEMERKARKVEQHPTLAAWAAEDRANATLVREDADALSSLWGAVASTWNKETQALGSAWDKGKMQVEYSSLGEQYRAGDDAALPKIQALRQRMTEAEKSGDGTLADSVGLATAAGQIPLQLNMMVPSATEAFGMGAAVWGASTLATAGTGATLGSVVPGAGTVLGGTAGATLGQIPAVGAGLTAAKATYLARQAQRSFGMERGAFIADLAQEQDANGDALPREVQNVAADVYGFLAAAVETGGEALFLRLLKPLGGDALVEHAGQHGMKGLLRSAVKRAAFDQSVRGALLDMGARIGINSLAEGLEESVQEVASILVEAGAKQYTGTTDDTVFLDTALFTPENAARLGASFTGGMAAGAWLGGGPIMISGAMDAHAAKQAQDFAQKHVALHAKVEESQTKNLSPTHMQDALESASPALRESVHLPADAVLELFQNGTDLLTPLGMDETAVASAASMGHALVVPVSRLHAHLDQSQFSAAARIMRRTPDTSSELDAESTEEKTEADAVRVTELFQQQTEEMAALDAERERVRAEAVAAVQSVPGLKTQAEALAGGTESYVDQWLTLLDGFARRMAPQGGTAADIFRRLAVAGLEGQRRSVQGVEDSIGQALFHPLNPGVDLDKTMPIVQAQRESAPLWQSMKGGKREIVRGIAGKLYNESTGLDMTLSAKNAEHLISSATSRGMGGEAHMAAVRNVRELMRVAELIDTYADRKQQEDVKNIHRFFAPLGYDGSVYAVNMTVKEYQGERDIQLDGVYKLYDLKLENKTPAGLADKLPEADTVVRPAGVLEEAPAGLADEQTVNNSPVRPASTSGITLRQLLEGVKDSEGNAYFAKREARTLWQPLNPGVDLNASVPLVTVESRFTGQNPKVLRKRFPKDIRAHVLAAFKTGVVNEDTGQSVGMSSRDFREHFKFAEGENETAHLEAIAVLPELMRTAKLVESHGDKKPSSGSQIRQVHRFMSALRVGRDDFAVMLTVKEFENGVATLDMENPVKLYHHRVEKGLSSSDADESAVSATAYTGRDEEQSPPRSPANTSTNISGQLKMPAGNSNGFPRSDIRQPSTGTPINAGNSNTHLNAGVNRPSANTAIYTLGALLEDVKDSEGKVYVANPSGVAGVLWQSGADKLAEGSAAWKKAVEDIAASGKVPSSPVRMLRQTPLVMQMIGAKERPVYAAPHAFDGTHPNITPDMLKGLPEALADPIAVFKSTQHKDRLVFMLEMTDAKGATVVVPMHLDGTKHHTTIHIATTVYAKERKGKPDNAWFEKQAGNALYVNRQKEKRWLMFSGSNSLWNAANALSGENIRTDADLVNLRAAHPDMYQRKDASQARGSIAPFSEGHLISLFKNANLSTLLHETGHAFMLEMENAVHSGMADESMVADFQALRQWVGGEAGQPLSREQHEQLARGFEAYLMEGRAPSQALESAFARFRRWMKTIYRAAKNLRVELNDEVRGVFDRMLAVEKEVAAASARNELLDLTARELDALGLTGPERTYAAGLMAAARSAAAERLQRVRDKERKKRLGQYSLEAKEELAREQVYTARSAMRATPLDVDAVREDFGGELARDVMRKVPGGLKSGGVDPEIFAAEHGYENGAALLRDIAASKSMKDAVEERAQTKDAEHDAAFAAEEYLLDTQEVAEQVDMVGQYLARQQGAEHVTQQAFARVAERELLSMPMGRAVRSSDFVAALRRALRDERQAIGRGDFAAALTANHKARLNLEFSRRSRDIQRRREDAESQIKRFVNMAKGDADARFMVMDIAMRHGLGKFRAGLAEGRDASTVRDWIAAAESEGYGIFVDDAVLYGQGKPWREMSTADFENLSETVTQIVTVERNRRKLLTARGKEELDAVVEDVATSILNNHAQRTLKTVERDPAIQRLAGNIHAVHTKVEALCLSLDGGKMGPAWEYIYRPITEAEDSQTLRFKAAREALRGPALFGAYARGELAKLARQKTLVPEVGEKLSHENRIALALNMGNEINMARIREGHEWNDAQIAAVLRPLTRRDWQFVQAVWDYLETFKAESFALQQDISGLRPTEVEAKPLSVTTADGHVLELRGGYYPIKYNSESGFRAFQQEQKALDKELFGGRNYGAAMTRHGHLKERTKVGLQTPLLLELSVVTDHVFNTIHDLSYRRAVLDVAKVIRHSRLREAMESTVGRELHRELMPWLQDVSNERQEPMHYVHRWVRWARSATSIMQMGYKVTTMLTQPLGFTQTVEVLGYRYAGAGLKTVYANPTRLPTLIEETFARSPMMAGRIKSFDRDVRDVAKQLHSRTGMFGWVDAVRDNAFVPMGVFQMGVDLPTWWGAYEKGMKDYAGDEKQAALYADSVVRVAQGSGATKDLARVQRGGDLLRMTTMFYSYFNTFYNLAARRFGELKRDRSPAAIFRAANTALLIWFVPAVLAELVAGRGPDDDEEAWKWAGKNIMQYPFQAVVGVRDVASGVFGEFGYQLTPAQSAPKSLVTWVNSVNKALEEEDAGKLIKPTAEAVGYLFGLPMKQPIITVGNVWDYMTGYDPEFEVRDLFFVKPKDRR